MRNVVALGLLMITPACGYESDAPAVVKAQVIVWDGFEQSNETTSFAVKEETLSTLIDFHNLTGPNVRLYRGGELVAREVAGSVALDGRLSAGHAPQLRYTVRGGVIVARDYSSLAMLSAYNALERSFVAVEQVLGFNIPDLGAKRPIDVFFEPRVRIDSDVSATVIQKFNAFFVPRAHQFGLARRSELEQAPLSADQMVLTHEIGHLVFEHFFNANDPPDCIDDNSQLPARDRLALEYAISGLNEGMADFLSFAVTGSTDVLAAQPRVKAQRSLIKGAFDFAAVNQKCENSFYCVGTVFARSLYQAFLAQGGVPSESTSRGPFAVAVIASLSGVLDKLAARTDLPGFELTESQCDGRDELFHPTHDAPILGAFLDTLAGQAPPPLDAALCAAFVANFGNAGFPEQVRTKCATAM